MDCCTTVLRGRKQDLEPVQASSKGLHNKLEDNKMEPRGATQKTEAYLKQSLTWWGSVTSLFPELLPNVSSDWLEMGRVLLAFLAFIPELILH